MPATIALGKTATFVFTEWSGPNGTGSVLPPAGQIIYASSNSTIATVNSAGTVLGISAGRVRIAAEDIKDHLEASDVLTVT